MLQVLRVSHLCERYVAATATDYYHTLTLPLAVLQPVVSDSQLRMVTEIDYDHQFMATKIDH